MAETDRDAFLARFAPGGSGVGFAVLGGSFAEGIDLPGNRLVGAFVATLGLPQVNPVNEQRRIRLRHSFGAGFDYAYLYPGVQKVVQAAGRVIRGPDDRGVLFLINDRLAGRKCGACCPAGGDPSSISQAATRNFVAGVDCARTGASSLQERDGRGPPPTCHRAQEMTHGIHADVLRNPG